MNLLKYTNKTNPTALISGVAVLTDEELTTFNVNIEFIKVNLQNRKQFRFRVGEEGGVYHKTIDNTDYAILTSDNYLLGDTGFARWFADGVLNLNEESFIELQTEMI